MLEQSLHTAWVILPPSTALGFQLAACNLIGPLETSAKPARGQRLRADTDPLPPEAGADKKPPETVAVPTNKHPKRCTRMSESFVLHSRYHSFQIFALGPATTRLPFP